MERAPVGHSVLGTLPSQAPLRDVTITDGPMAWPPRYILTWPYIYGTSIKREDH